MGTEWIAVCISIAACVVAFIGVVIAYKKYNFDKSAKLPHVGWRVLRERPREMYVTIDVINTRPFSIEVTGFFAIYPNGSTLLDEHGFWLDGSSDFSSVSADGRVAAFMDGEIPPNEPKSFRVKIIIADDQPAPVPVRAVFELMIDLRDGSGADHRFQFNRNV